MKRLFIFLLFLTSTAQAQTFDINELNLDQYKGKVVYIDFWASWCKPCQVSFPWMNKINLQYQDKAFKLITINLDEDSSDMNQFLTKIEANFDIYHDPSGSIAEQFKLEGMPTSYIINKSGKVVKKHIGFYLKKTDQYEQEIEALL